MIACNKVLKGNESTPLLRNDYGKLVEHKTNTDKWVIDHASQHGSFSDLYQGSWAGIYGSQSEADLSLCLILAFWTDRNTEQIDRIFRSSGLYRDKWERQDYRDNTIENAISQCDVSFSEFIRKEGDRFDEALSQRWDS